MASLGTAGTILTEKQARVLAERERGRTQREIAEQLGTTASNVSAIERAAEANVEKAHQTLALARTLRAPARITVDAGTAFDELVREVYERGDAAGIKVDYCRPELYSHLYAHLQEHCDRGEITSRLTIGLTREGTVELHAAAEP